MLTLQNTEHGVTIAQEISAAFHGCHSPDLLLICAGNETLRAHKLILAAASPLIRELLSDRSFQNEEVTTMHFPDISVYYFRLLLFFLYSGEAWLPAYDVPNFHDLLILLEMSESQTIEDSSENDSVTKINTNTNSIPQLHRLNSWDSSRSHISVKSERSIVSSSGSENIQKYPELELAMCDLSHILKAEHSPSPISSLTTHEQFKKDSDKSRSTKIKLDRNYSCKYCDKQFDFLRNLKNHQVVHKAERPFGCQLCTAKFSKKYNVFTHISHKHQNLIEPDQFRCNFCPQSFESRLYLVRHLCRAHNNLCARPPGSRSNGSRIRPDREYRCKYCDKSFRMLHYLKLHILLHTGNQPFACRLCNTAFLQKGNLLFHLYSKHRNLIRLTAAPDRYTCCFCSQSFETKEYLNQHFAQQHENLLLNQN